VEIQDERTPFPWPNVPRDERLAVIRHKAQFLDAAHTRFGWMSETPVREIQKAALKDSHADDRQHIDRPEKDQRPLQLTFPLLEIVRKHTHWHPDALP
jgi:hypothetical protein